MKEMNMDFQHEDEDIIQVIRSRIQVVIRIVILHFFPYAFTHARGAQEQLR